MKRFEKEDDIRKFVCEMHRYEMEQLPAKETLEKNYRLSETFFAKMRQLVERMTRREKRKRIEQYVAAAAVIVLLLFGMANPSVVAQTFAGIWEWFTDHVEIHFKEEDTGLTMVPEYTLSYVPEGYELIHDEYMDTAGVIAYQKEDDLILFDYGLADSSLYLNNEGVKFASFTRDGTVIYCFESTNEEKATMLVWLNDNEDIQFCVSGYLPMSEMLEIYDGVCEKNK